MKIYLLSEYIDYEGSTVIQAYPSLNAAENAKRLCEDYRRDVAYDDNWYENHPVLNGTSYHTDGFIVTETELVE